MQKDADVEDDLSAIFSGHPHIVLLNDGMLAKDKVPALLHFFYRLRPEGPTQSGSFLYHYPESEYNFLMGLYGEGEETLAFAPLLDVALCRTSASVTL